MKGDGGRKFSETVSMLRFSGDSVASGALGYSTGCIYGDPSRGIFILIDGEGDANAGEQFAAQILPLLTARMERETGRLDERIREAITLASNELFVSNQAQPDNPPLTCSIAIAVALGTEITFGRVGSARAYLIAPRSINRITIEPRDDAAAAPLSSDAARADESTPSSSSPAATTALAGTQEHEPEDEDFIEVVRINFSPESALLVCSPVLTTHLADDEILRTVRRHPGNRARVVRSLAKAAAEAGCEKSFSLLFVENEKLAPEIRKERGPGHPS